MIGPKGSGQAATMITAIERIAGIGDWRMPVSGRLITLSANACRLLQVDGTPPDTLDGLIALYDAQDQSLLREACARVLSGSEEKRFEVDARMKVAGREVWFRHRAEVCPAPPDGTVTLICVFQDVSREKIDGLEVARLRAQAQSEKDRLQAAASAGIVGVWDWDVTHNVLAWDEVMYRLYGLKAGDFGGAFEAWTSAVHAEDRAGAEEAIAAALRGEREYEYLFRVVWPTDGSTHFIKAVSRTSFDASGKAARMIGVNYDVTEQMDREQALKDATRVAEEANRAKSEFLARMSHEIRTPMNAVIGLSAMGMELPDLPPVAADWMRRIHQSSSALMSTINDILDFSKIEAHQMDLDPQEFELEALIENSVDLFGLAAHQKGLQLVIDVDQALPRFFGGGCSQADPDPQQPAGQCDQVHRVGAGLVECASAAVCRRAQHPQRRAAFFGAGLGHRHRAREHRRPLPALRASRRVDLAALWRHRSGPGHQPASVRVDGRQHQGRKPARHRDHF
jgi:PAS domain S-box-containing protein